MSQRTKRTMIQKGDLVSWLGFDSEVECHGIVLDVWESNVYEPEECEIFVDETTTFMMRSRNLKLVSKAKVN